MPHADPEARRECDKKYRSRPDVRDRCNAAVRRRYRNGGSAKRCAYDARRRKSAEFRQLRAQFMADYKIRGWAELKIAALRTRARKLGVPFNLVAQDLVLPNVCPVFGTTLRIGTGKQSNDSPSVDRIIPALGYVKGNVLVVSLRANSLKRDMSLTDMKRLVEFYSQFHQ